MHLSPFIQWRDQIPLNPDLVSKKFTCELPCIKEIYTQLWSPRLLPFKCEVLLSQIQQQKTFSLRVILLFTVKASLVALLKAQRFLCPRILCVFSYMKKGGFMLQTLTSWCNSSTYYDWLSFYHRRLIDTVQPSVRLAKNLSVWLVNTWSLNSHKMSITLFRY